MHPTGKQLRYTRYGTEEPMSQSGKIIVLGASLLMQMVADGLTKALNVGVIHLNPLTVDVLAQIKQLNPDVVIVERTRNPTADMASMTLELLYNYPGLYIVGVDASQPITYKLYSVRMATNTIQELAQELSIYQQPEP